MKITQVDFHLHISRSANRTGIFLLITLMVGFRVQLGVNFFEPSFFCAHLLLFFMVVVELQARPAVDFVVRQFGFRPNLIGYGIPDVLHGNDALLDEKLVPSGCGACE